MRRISKLPLLVLVCALAALVSAPGAGAAAKPKLKLLTTSQKQILKGKGAVKVKVASKRPGKVKVKALSSTFDKPKPAKLGRTKKVRFRSPGAKRLSLKLNKAGRKAIKSCEARELLVKAGKAKKKADLKRDTKRCKPKKVDLSRADSCDFIGQQEGSMCMLPFPDDYYTVEDPSSATGRRVNFKDSGMPQNAAGTPIAAAPYNLNDGFSPGQAIITKVSGLDNPQALAATDPIPLNRLSRNGEADAESAPKQEPVLVFDADTGERWPIWVEIDSQASSPEETTLLIHPAKNYVAGHRYIVVMRDLKRADGSKIEAPEGFRYLRDDLPTKHKQIKSQRKRFERIFKSLRNLGVKRANLYLAWDFTVASDENIAERMLHIRDDAFAQLGDTDLDDLTVQGTAPSFSVGTVTDYDPCGGDGCQAGEDENIERRVEGTFTVPCYLQPNCAPGGRFELGANGLPSQNGTWAANFNCIVPRAVVDTPGAVANARPSLYGHGLLGSANEAFSRPQRTLAQAHGFVTCATDEIGFSTGDIANIATNILPDLSNFPELTDRVQQGLLNELYLGRLMINPQGFLTHPAFHVDGVSTGSAATIDTQRLYYNGNSQGGILGGALTAIAPDFTRASLGVPAMNYSVLLNRSIDYDAYKTILDPNYPSAMTQQLVIGGLVQMLWDRSEANGYAHRMTSNPLPNTPAHEVLMNVAFGDHQVTTFQADVEARTIGAQAHEPVVYDGRWPDMDVLWGIPRISSYPYAGSAIVYWDTGPTRPDPGNPGEEIGTDPPPLENIPNRSGADPHGAPRAMPAEQQMVSDFLRPNPLSNISDTCLGLPCYAGGFTGP